MSVDQSALWASAAVKNYDLKCAQTLLAALNTCFIVFCMCRGCFVSRTWSASCCSAIVALPRGLEALELNAFAFDSLWCESEHCTGSHGCRSLKNTVHWSKTSFLRSSMILHAQTAPYPFKVKKLKTQAKLRCGINGRLSWVNPCYGPKFRFVGIVLLIESEFEVSFDVDHTPGEWG